MSQPTTSAAAGDAAAPAGRQHEPSHAPANSSRANLSVDSELSDESTPLLSRTEDTNFDSGAQPTPRPSTPSAQSLQEESTKKGFFRRRWPTVVALSTLSLAMLLIIALGFATPALVEEYAQQAADFRPTNLSIDSFTAKGVNARIQGDFVLDASKVQKSFVKDLGRAATWLAGAVEARPRHVEAVLPEYGDVLLGSADIPPLVVSIKNGETSHLDFVARLETGDLDAVRRIANDWMQGNLAALRVQGRSEVALKSGFLSLGTQVVSRDLVFQGSSLPSVPKYDIKKLNVHELKNDSRGGIHADVDIAVFNDYPVTFTVPPLHFSILVPGCSIEADNIHVANASTSHLRVTPKEMILVSAEAAIRHLPETLVALCPNSQSSPLDALLSSYMHGKETTVSVKGSSTPAPDTPQWLSELMEQIIVPVSVTGRSFSNFIEKFSMKDVHFSMPNPLADPDSPSAKPRISATVQVLAKLPEEINLSIDVPRVRADSDVFYKGKKLGNLDLHRWQKARSSRVNGHGKTSPKMIVESSIEDAPLNVTDQEVLSEVVQDLFFGNGSLQLGIKALVDAEISTVLGAVIVRGIPAEGKVPIRPLSDHQFGDLGLQVGQLKLTDTTKSSISLQVKVNLTNPTNYSASLPYADVNLSWNDTLLGHAAVQNLSILPGANLNIPVQVVWDPLLQSGKAGILCSRELISRYVSGYNTTLTLNMHSRSIPFFPQLGEYLSNLSVKVPTPRLSAPPNPKHPGKAPEGDHPQFIDDAVMHLWSSTATFTLLSPLSDTTIYLTHINATAFYNHTEPVGRILYELPFAVPPGATTSPDLPVDWSLGGVGYDAVKDALGGRLKLDARAYVGVRIGNWEDRVWFRGSGIGASIKI